MQELKDLVKPFSSLVDEPDLLFVVGGAVRDTILGEPISDIDFVVVGSEQVVADIFKCKPVAAHPSAPVFTVKFGGEIFEVALARTEKSVGQGSEAFSFSPAISIEEDLHRRDFTVNAVAVDCWDGKVRDPFQGVDDIKRKLLHPVSKKFTESPERVGRAAMMIARFGFLTSSELDKVCRGMVDDFAAIPPEQMWRQFFEKMIAKGRFFSQAFRWLQNVDALSVFPELVAMKECHQNPAHHPEGDVLMHTALAMEVAVKMDMSFLVKSALLFHDMGKPLCTEGVGLSTTAHGHEHKTKPMLAFMNRIGFPHALRDGAVTLVQNHMRKNDIPTERSRARLLRKLVAGGVTAEDFADVIFCDINGKGQKAFTLLPMHVIRFLEFASSFEPSEVSEAARPLIDGNDLIEADFKPGRLFSMILDKVHEGFLSGELKTKDDAMALARKVRRERE